MPVTDRRVRRVLSDWTFLGAVIVTIALVLSIVFGRATPSTAVMSVLVAFWAVVLILQYERILALLDEMRACRAELNSGFTRLRASQSDLEIAKKLPLISLDAFADKETRLQPGDCVLVFANTLEIDFKPMFDVVVSNLRKGVLYKYILFENDQSDDWDKFIRILKRERVTNIPAVHFEKSRIASLVKSSSVIYDFEAHGKQPEGFCVLKTSGEMDTCVLMSKEIAVQTREAFYRTWRSLGADTTNKLP